MTSKGHISIQVWDDDVTSADCLGGCQVTLGDILNVRATQKRTLLGAVRAEKHDEEDENELEEKQEKHNQWYEVPKPVRVYDGSKTALGQSALANKDAALIHFEAYFYPDWAETLRFEDEVQEADAESVWAKKGDEWNSRNLQKAEDYALPFPDSIGAKKTQGGKHDSNCRFLATIPLHWIAPTHKGGHSFDGICLPNHHSGGMELSSQTTRVGSLPIIRDFSTPSAHGSDSTRWLEGS